MNQKLRFSKPFWLFMKISLQQMLLCLLFFGLSRAHKSHGQEILNQSVSLAVENAEMKQVLTLIERQVNVRFVYSSSAINTKQKMSIRVTNKRLDLVLEEILKPFAIKYVVSENRILLQNETTGFVPNAPAEKSEKLPPTEQLVKGRISDAEKGEGLPGVSVLVRGTQRGTTIKSVWHTPNLRSC